MLIKSFAILSALTFTCTAEPLRGADMVRQNIGGQRQAVRKASPMGSEVTSIEPSMYPDFGITLRSMVDEIDEHNVVATSVAAPTNGEAPPVSSSWIPDVRIYDQNGKQLNFYSDIVKGNTAAINFIFTTCTTICPQTTAIFRRVQQILTKRGIRVKLISISVDPTTDTPERLHAFADKFSVGPGWTFVTGDKIEIDSLLQALNAGVSDKNSHTPRILVINDTAGYRTGISGFSTPEAIVQVITEAAGHK